MKATHFSLMAGLAVSLFAGAAAFAGDSTVQRKHVVAIDTGSGAMSKLDISDLQVGEALETVSADGTAIDVLRTADGFELYLDGELQDAFGEALHAIDGEDAELYEIECEVNGPDEECAHIVALARQALVTREFEIICTEEDACEELSWHELDHVDGALHAEHDVKVIRIKQERSETTQ